MSGTRATTTAIVASAVLLAACTPVTAPPPSSPASETQPEIVTADVGTQATCPNASQAPDPEPTPAAPVEYVATYDADGPGASEYVTFTAASEAELAAEIDSLDARGEILTLEPNRPVSALTVMPLDDQGYGGQYGLKTAAADFETAWGSGLDGTGVRIAIVDTGVRLDHQDLALHVDTLRDRDFVNNDLEAADDHGHGTHVAGIAAALDNVFNGLGGAPEATILPVKVLESSGSGTIDDVAAGIEYAANPLFGDADIINLSLGGSGCEQAIQNAIAYALGQGVVVVAAAGNCGDGPNAGCPTKNAAIYPAAGPDTDVIAVGSTTSANQRSSFSNSNPRRREPPSWPQALDYVDVAAPGSFINSTLHTSTTAFGSMSGTSMATPFVAAAAALLLQKCPSLWDHGPTTSADVKAMLEATAVFVADEATAEWPEPHTILVNDLGFGLIKVGATVAQTCPA